MIFNVFNGEYPFDVFLGQVEAPHARIAMMKAKKFHPNPVLQPEDPEIQPEQYNGEDCPRLV